MRSRSREKKKRDDGTDSSALSTHFPPFSPSIPLFTFFQDEDQRRQCRVLPAGARAGARHGAAAGESGLFYVVVVVSLNREGSRRRS